MTRKKMIIRRFEASELRPKKLKSFSVKKFVEAATNLEEAIRKEEKRYGPTSRLFT